VPPPNPAGSAAVSDLPFLSESNGWGPVERDRSNGESSGGDGHGLSIKGTAFAKGLGMHAAGEVTVWLGSACTAFTAQVGIDDEVGQSGSVEFQVYDGDKQLATSGVVRTADGAKTLTADVTGVRVLTLRATDGGDGKNYDHADWGAPTLTCS
jgi:alpha-glucosidase